MQFSCVVSTSLPCDRVWDIFTDIQNWSTISSTGLTLRWVGQAWAQGSYLQSRLPEGDGQELCHLVRSCQAPSSLRLLSYGNAAGFAVESTIRLEQVAGRTLIHVDAYAVGNPLSSQHGAVADSLTGLVERWFRDFAQFCDCQLAPA